MRIESIEEFTNKQLLEIASKDYGIEYFSDAKNPHKPNKQEIADAINDFIDNSLDFKAKPKAPAKKKKTASDIKKELLALHRVEITELRKIESFENDDSNRCVFITWGNDVVGHVTNRVVFNTPWMLPIGCIENLKSVEYSPVSNKGSVPVTLSPRPAYRVVDLGLPSEEELKAIATRQRLREAQGE